MTSNEERDLAAYLRDRFVRRYNLAFTGAVVLGAVLVPHSLTAEDAVMLFPVGVSLIISGAVGLAMSFMTSKVAEELKSVIREEGQRNYEKLESMDSTLKRIEELLRSR